MPTKPNTNRTRRPAASHRRIRTYTAVHGFITDPKGNRRSRWYLLSERGQLVVFETSERRFWQKVRQWIQWFSSMGFDTWT